MTAVFLVRRQIVMGEEGEEEKEEEQEEQENLDRIVITDRSGKTIIKPMDTGVNNEGQVLL